MFRQVCPPGKKQRLLRLSSSFLLIILVFCVAGCAGLVAGKSTDPPPVGLAITSAGASNPTTSGFQVNWTTNVAANSAVDYGTTAAYGTSTPMNTAMVTSHQMLLSGLSAGTQYHYRVRSIDANNSSAVGADLSFTTAGSTTPPPAITGLASGSV